MNLSIARRGLGHGVVLAMLMGSAGSAQAMAAQPVLIARGAGLQQEFKPSYYPVVQPIPGATTAATPAATEAPQAATTIPADETEAQRKARLKAEQKARKAAERAERDRLRAEEKERKRAERQARGGSNTGKLIASCLIGGILGALATRAVGGKKANMAAGAAAGCAVGLAFTALSKKDNEKLNTYVNDDFMLQEDDCNKVWRAEESQKDVSISCGQTTYRNASHSFYLENDVVFDQSNIQVAESVKYATTSARLRSSPMATGTENIIGGYSRGNKILTYGTTNDGKWTYVVEKLPDGKYELLGYISSSLLAAKAPSAEARGGQYARLQATPAASNRAAAQRAAPQRTASAAPRPAKKVDVVANTRCKTANISVGQEAKTATKCSGANLAFVLPLNSQERKA